MDAERISRGTSEYDSSIQTDQSGVSREGMDAERISRGTSEYDSGIQTDQSGQILLALFIENRIKKRV